ncbi:MAG: hypothetical protein KDC27_07475, partial [Acidobacteria bacterium]|nr:hypothetical protein [Acidobacteriota bacterium]
MSPSIQPATLATANRRRVAYSLAAGAAALASSADANAAVIYSGVQNISVAQFGTQNINLDGDAYNDILLKNYV